MNEIRKAPTKKVQVKIFDFHIQRHVILFEMVDPLTKETYQMAIKRNTPQAEHLFEKERNNQLFDLEV